MSFTRIIDGKKLSLRLRCGKCGSTKRVFPVATDGGRLVVDLCFRCRKDAAQ